MSVTLPVPGVIMLFASIYILFLAIALPSLRISPFFIRMETNALLYLAALFLGVVYIQSIGSDIVVLSDLFHGTLTSQSIEISPDANLGVDNTLLYFSLLPVKPKLVPNAEKEKMTLLEDLTRCRLTDLEKEQLVLTDELKQILISILLGDGYCQKQGVNNRFKFEQGIIHEDYLMHLYGLFSAYCGKAPIIKIRPPKKITGKSSKSIYFNTFSLPCFVELGNLFYPDGKKIIPLNIGDLLTPLSLCYWICDDGCFHKTQRSLYLCTNSFTLEEVNLLMSILTNKFNLKCTINKHGSGFRIRVSSKSLPVLQSLLKDIMPTMMLYKIGL
jgi:hypothetical protein